VRKSRGGSKKRRGRQARQSGRQQKKFLELFPHGRSRSLPVAWRDFKPICASVRRKKKGEGEQRVAEQKAGKSDIWSEQDGDPGKNGGAVAWTGGAGLTFRTGQGVFVISSEEKISMAPYGGVWGERNNMIWQRGFRRSTQIGLEDFRVDVGAKATLREGRWRG